MSARPGPNVDVRDHEANERTYFAWARTGVTLIALGIALSELILVENQPQRLVGAIAALAGVWAIGLAFVQFFRVEHRLERAAYVPHRVGPLILSVLLTAGGVLAIVVLSV